MKQRRRKLGQTSGFTLVEIMIVLAIVAALFSIVGVNVMDQFKKSKDKTALIQLAALESALETYFVDNGQYPLSNQGLEALKSKPTTPPIPKDYPSKGYLKKKLPVDPWGSDYGYRCDSGQEYEIWSFGPDKQDGTDDDIKTSG